MMEMLKWGVAAMLLTLFATAQASAVSQWWVSRSSSAVVTRIVHRYTTASEALP
jgi:hypothetical protein